MNENPSSSEGARDAGPSTVPSDWASLRGGAAGRPPEQVHTLAFSGSGSEYFRIWIINLLLTLVTLGLYHPWAKARKLRYFYGNTRLAGHAFDFHGDPKRMLRGYLLVGGLFALYAIAGQFSPIAGLVALAIVAAIWPALQRASMRFRLAQTSWRGLRFQFVGDTAGAYKALLPAFVALIVMVGVSALSMPSPPAGAVDAAPEAPRGFALIALFGSLALFYGMLPLTFWMLKRYQHDNYQYANVRTRFTAGPGSFYWLALKATGLLLLAIAVAGGLIAIFAVGAGTGGARSAGRFVIFMVIAVAAYGAVLLAIQPYVTSRMQNLVWSSTDSRRLGFASALRFWPLARLMLVNWLLIVVTLGFYWPFAAIAMARIRLQALSVTARSDLDALVARGGASTQDASGDAAADLFGIDIGM